MKLLSNTQKKVIRSKKSSAASSQSSAIFNQSRSLVFDFRFSPAMPKGSAVPLPQASSSLQSHGRTLAGAQRPHRCSPAWPSLDSCSPPDPKSEHGVVHGITQHGQQRSQRPLCTGTRQQRGGGFETKPSFSCQLIRIIGFSQSIRSWIAATRPRLWWKGLFWFQTQMENETRALMGHTARDRQSHLHFLVPSGRVMKAEVLPSDEDPRALSEDMFH